MHFPRPSVFAAACCVALAGTAAFALYLPSANALSLPSASALNLSSAFALDHPGSGAKLQLIRKNGKEKLVFVSKDPGFLFPATGSGDDPSLNGAIVDLFPTPVAAAGQLTLPAALGKPGWTFKAGNAPQYTFDNALAPGGLSGVRVAVLKQGKQIKVIAKSLGGLTLGGLTGVGIRVTTGSLRNCALFGPSAIIKRSDATTFSAIHAPPNTVGDCSDASLGAPSSCDLSPFPICGGSCPGDSVCMAGFGICECISPSSPCGDTAPVCNGTCPLGEACTGTSLGVPSCFCIPEGQAPCGDQGPPVCGGACPSGNVCTPAFAPASQGGGLGCVCAPPAPCGAGGSQCGNGFACAPVPGNPICAPMGCAGTYPTCGGACGHGGVCEAVNVPIAALTTCVCAVPGPCDSGCGGYDCSGAEVCTVDSGSCSCQ